jgi:hypothetical protein
VAKRKKETNRRDYARKRAGSVVERTAGALKSHKPPLTPEELRVAAEKAMAQEAIDRDGHKG